MRHVTWVLTAMAAAVMGGCGSDTKDPVKPPVQSGIPYPDRSTPQNVLATLVTAYQTRDSVVTKDLYDVSYMGTSQDMLNPVNTFTFTYHDEVGHVAALRRSSTIVSISVDFGATSTWTRITSDDPSHPEYALIQLVTPRVEIVDGATFYQTDGGLMSYYFKPTQDAASPTDTLWRVIRWNEIGNNYP